MIHLTYDKKTWDKYGLQEFGDYADCVEYINQTECWELLEGEWYYIPDEDVVIDGNSYRVIYYGTFGNDNVAGASGYTWAHIFNTASDDDMERFRRLSEELENAPEYLDLPDPEQGQDKDGNGYPDRF